MDSFFRQYLVTPTSEMTDTNTRFLRDAVSIKGAELQELSVAIGYGKYYLETCIFDGRMPIIVLKFLSEFFDFDYNKAIVKKKKKNKK